MEVSRGKTLRKPLLSGVSCSCRTSRVGSWTPHLPQSWSYPGWMVLWSIFARSFFLNQFLNFNWRLNSSQYCGFFCHTSTQISHRGTCVPHPKRPSHLLPHPIPLGFSSAPVLSVLFHAFNLYWSSIWHMVIYMFQCYSLKSSHPCLLPESKSLFSISVSLLLSHV